jgi:hypothetical protein
VGRQPHASARGLSHKPAHAPGGGGAGS